MSHPPLSNLALQYRSYNRQKCFVACSQLAPWTEDLLGACKEVLTRPEFNLEPDYAGKGFDSGVSLQQKALELIANARYGIYDLSCWQDERGEWQLPRNVYVELGMAIALNRPALMLRHNRNRHLKLPACLESMSGMILEFGGTTTLKRTLENRLPQWLEAPPEVGFWNRYCVPGNRICEFRESHPRASQWGRKTLQCHISDGPDEDRVDFRALVEDVLGRFSDVSVSYLDALSPMQGYDFLLCSHCKSVRSSSFAIYRITPATPAETFIAIGISLVLEQQFGYKIPKLLLVEKLGDLPSLLTGYEVVVARNDRERKDHLRRFMPTVMQKVREASWTPRPLPFHEIRCVPEEALEKPEAEESALAEETETDQIEAQAEPEAIRESAHRASGVKYSFAEFELDATEMILRKSGKIIRLQPKAVQALELLVRNAGRAVKREEMIEALWPGRLDIKPRLSNLHFIISSLRRALADTSTDVGFIQTVPKRGYRFIPDVDVSKTEAPKADNVEIVFCGFCGERVALDEIFCAHCGSRQPFTRPGTNQKRTAWLTIVGGKRSGLVLDLSKGNTLIGRSDAGSKIFPELDLTEEDPEAKISRRHARIWREGSEFLIEDLDSVNGTIINDSVRLAPRQPRHLESGDRLRLGLTTLQFRIAKPDAQEEEDDDDEDYSGPLA